jgi:predicted RNA binding protein YcfA (HicA-like mRNA interferase family)
MQQKQSSSMTQNEMVKLLLDHGGVKVKGGKGSHVKVRFPGVNRPIIVPQKLPKGTENGILKQAGLK